MLPDISLAGYSHLHSPKEVETKSRSRRARIIGTFKKGGIIRANPAIAVSRSFS
jgi:hypothetical protein